jgi:hypothetical protein
MWKSIVLCMSLFGGAALGLALGARFVEPGALPAAAAIGLCLIGVVLILSAPTAADEEGTGVEHEGAARLPVVNETNVVDPMVDAPAAMATVKAPVTPVVKNRTPSMPLEALNS